MPLPELGFKTNKTVFTGDLKRFFNTKVRPLKHFSMCGFTYFFDVLGKRTGPFLSSDIDTHIHKHGLLKISLVSPSVKHCLLLNKCLFIYNHSLNVSIILWPGVVTTSGALPKNELIKIDRIGLCVQSWKKFQATSNGDQIKTYSLNVVCSCKSRNTDEPQCMRYRISI